MSEALGPLRYASDQEEIFLGHSVAHQKNMSDETAAKVDAEIRRIVSDAYTRAQKILSDRLNELEKLAHALLEYEMLTGEEIKAVLRGEKIVRESPEDDEQSRPSSSVPKGGAVDLGNDGKEQAGKG